MLFSSSLSEESLSEPDENKGQSHVDKLLQESILVDDDSGDESA